MAVNNNSNPLNRSAAHLLNPPQYFSSYTKSLGGILSDI